MDDLLEPHNLENLRRSIAMVQTDRPALDRNKALHIIRELQRLEKRDRRVTDLVAELQAVLADEG